MTTRYGKSITLASAGLVLVLASAEAQQAAPTNDSKDRVVAMAPRTLEWMTASSLPQGATLTIVHGDPKEAEPLTIRLKFPANYQVPPHFHPVTEHVTVLSGALHIGIGGKLDKSTGETLPVEGFVRVPAGVPHYAWTTEETVIQLHSNKGPWAVSYVNPQDDPRTKAS